MWNTKHLARHAKPGKPAEKIMIMDPCATCRKSLTTYRSHVLSCFARIWTKRDGHWCLFSGATLSHPGVYGSSWNPCFETSRFDDRCMAVYHVLDARLKHPCQTYLQRRSLEPSFGLRLFACRFAPTSSPMPNGHGKKRAPFLVGLLSLKGSPYPKKDNRARCTDSLFFFPCRAFKKSAGWKPGAGLVAGTCTGALGMSRRSPFSTMVRHLFPAWQRMWRVLARRVANGMGVFL